MKQLFLSTALIAATGFAGFTALADTTTAPAAATDTTTAPATDTTTTAPAATDTTTTAPAATDTTTTAPADTTATAPAMTDTTATAPAMTDTTTAARTPVVRDGYSVADMTAVSADKLIGTKAYDSTDASIGEVSDLIVGTDGKITDVIVDVGGFLGMGEKPVALKISDIDILKKSDGDDMRVYISMTKDQLEGMQTYSK